MGRSNHFPLLSKSIMIYPLDTLVDRFFSRLKGAKEGKEEWKKRKERKRGKGRGNHSSLTYSYMERKREERERTT